VDLRCKKTKSTFQKAKANKKSEKTNSFAAKANKKSEKTNSFIAKAVLRLRLLKSTCAIGVGLGATVSVDLCHWSGLEYLSNGFQT
jgi:hypothetical protein